MKRTFETRPEEEKKKRKKAIVVFLLIVFALICCLGSLIAFFSDVIWRDSTVSTGRLKITADYTYAVNGVAATGAINNLSPGDVIVITANVSNQGNMSAWVREVIDFNIESSDFLPFIEVYSGEYTRQQLELGGVGGQLDVQGGRIVTAARVLNGTGEGAQTESGGGFEYINADNYQNVFTVYFLPEATNELQDSNFGIRVTTEALQFANNNAGVPGEAAWASISPSPAV